MTGYFTIEESVSLPQFMDTAVSEDGQRVAYTRKTANWNENTYRQHVWVYDKKINKSYPVTVAENESMQPRWSPDSRSLAFLSPVGSGEDKKTQIFVQTNVESGTIQVSCTDNSVESFKWAPDGNRLFFTAKRPDSEKMKQRKEMYGDYVYVDQDFHYNALYSIALDDYKRYDLPKDMKKNSEETPLTESMHRHICHYDISPDGQKVVFNATPTPRVKDFHEQDIYLLDTNSGDIEKLDVTPLHVGTVLFSHDGSKICYNRYKEKQFILNNITLEIYDLTTKETTQPVADLDEHVYPICWVASGILLSWQERTNYLVGVVTEEGELHHLVDRYDTVVSFPSISSDGEHFAYVKASSAEPHEVYLNNDRITDQYKLYQGRERSEKEILRWETTDGLEIEGILSKPVDHDPSRTYPLIVAVHGGPVAASTATPTMNKYQPIEQFVEKEFLVLEPNYRGGSGYGEAFRKANYRKLGIGDYEDVISGVDTLIDRDMADPDKVGILGWSQGGYISAFCATYSHRFKAISVGAGISNWMTYYANTDITPFARYYLGDTPWNDEEIFRVTSPMTYINHATTPTLIQHGEKDERVPVPNAYELYRGLKDVGVDTELVIYKDMKHGSNKPGLNRAIMKQNLDWFAHYML